MKQYLVADIDQIGVYETKYSSEPPSPEDGLYQNIVRNGIKVPLLVDSDMRLMDGLRRLRIARKLGYTKVPVIICASIREAADVNDDLRANSERFGFPQDWSPRRIYQMYLDTVKLRVRSRSDVKRKNYDKQTMNNYRNNLTRIVGLPNWRTSNILSMYRTAEDHTNPLARRMQELLRDAEDGTYTYSAAWQKYLNERDKRDFFMGEVVEASEQLRILEESVVSLSGIMRGLASLGPPSKRITSTKRFKEAGKRLAEEKAKLYRFIHLLKEKTSVAE